MLQILKRLLDRPTARSTIVHRDVGATLVAHRELPDAPAGADAMTPPLQVDGDPAGGRPVVQASLPGAPRDVFVVPGGLGLPALALVNLRDPRPRVELWALDASSPAFFAERCELRFPPDIAPSGWQVTQVASLPRLQCLVVLRDDAEPRTARVAVLDLASLALRELGIAEPDPFADGLGHCAALRVPAGGVLVRWHSGRVKLGRWGDVALEDHVMLFTPRERDGLEVLTLALDDGNVRAWALQGDTLWLQAIDGRLRPAPRVHAWSLDLSRVL
jgi:hypothetical protein